MNCVLITGACGGIGSAIAEKFIDNGFFVFGLDRKSNDYKNENFCFIETDITSDESVKNSFIKVSSMTDSLYAIINTAGIVFMGSLVEEDPSLMQKILDVNVSGTARVNNIFFPLIEKNKGRIINFSSEYGKYCAVPFHGYYTASKHALEAYNDSLRREMNYLDIKVIAIRPGAINTTMTAGTVPYFKEITERTSHYKKTYLKLYPLMAGATKKPYPAQKVADKIYKVSTVKHPKRFYKIHQDFRVKLLSLLPSKLVDFIFKHFI